MLLTLSAPAVAKSSSVYGYTNIGGAWVNNITGAILRGKPAPSIEKNASKPSAAALKAIRSERERRTRSRVRVSRGVGRTHPYEAQIKAAGTAYWVEPAELDALVWISARECMKPGGVSPNGKYKGLFQLGSPPRWMVLGDAASETKAGCEYIKRRYGTPLKAKAFKLSHGWY